MAPHSLHFKLSTDIRSSSSSCLEKNLRLVGQRSDRTPSPHLPDPQRPAGVGTSPGPKGPRRLPGLLRASPSTPLDVALMLEEPYQGRSRAVRSRPCV